MNEIVKNICNLRIEKFGNKNFIFGIMNNFCFINIKIGKSFILEKGGFSCL